MNTNDNTPIRSENNVPEGQLSKNTNTAQKYEARLTFTQHSRATVIIEAASLEEAEEKAKDIQADEIDDGNPFDGEVYVLEVEPVEGEDTND